MLTGSGPKDSHGTNDFRRETGPSFEILVSDVPIDLDGSFSILRETALRTPRNTVFS